MLSLHLHIHPPPQPIVERLSLVYLAWVSDVCVGVIGPAGSRLSLVLPGPHALIRSTSSQPNARVSSSSVCRVLHPFLHSSSSDLPSPLVGRQAWHERLSFRFSAFFFAWQQCPRLVPSTTSHGISHSAEILYGPAF
jgi:hypothetical protein